LSREKEFDSRDEVNNQEEFFKTVLDIKDKFDFDGLIYSQESHDLKELEDKIFEKYGVKKYDLECEYRDGEQELFAIYFCFDLDFHI